MEKQVAELITQFKGEIYEDYSGRGMFGDTTTGVAVESESDFNDAVMSIMEDESIDASTRQEVSKAFRRIKSDSMGFDVIFY